MTKDKLSYQVRLRRILIYIILLSSIFLTACSSQRTDLKEEDQLVESEGNDHKDNENPTHETRSKEESKTTEPAKEELPEISLTMVGDILLHTNIHESGKMEDGSLNYDHLFANVKEDIESFDRAIVTQEFILRGKELGLSGYPTFNGAYEVGDALVNAGFNVVLHATNHTLDKGKKGVLNTINYWKNNHPQIGVLGINESQAAQEEDIFIYEKDGIKLAILNYTYGTNGIPLPSDMPFIVNLLSKEKIEKDVIRAKEIADFIIVAPHWGIEYMHTPSKEQEDLAYFMAELGVDLVIGTHPHVIQPVEWIEAGNGNRMLIYYSLGNFINSTSGTGDGVADRMVGAMADVTIRRNENDEVYIHNYQAVPIVTQMLTGPGLITSYKFDDYSQELAMENEIIKQDPNFSFEYCIKIWNETFPDFIYSHNQ